MQTSRLLSIVGGVTAIAALALPLIVTPRDAYAQQVLTVQLDQQNSSGQTGTAVLTGQGNRTLVLIQTTGGPGGTQPAHIHMGSCANLNPRPEIPLTSVTNGRSETVIDVPLSTVADGNHAINIHKSVAEAQIYTSCGDIPTMAGAAGQGGPSGQGGPGGPGMGNQPAPQQPPAQQPPAQQPPAQQPPAQQPPAAPQANASVPQFGGSTTLAWPPVFSGELQATVGDATVIIGLVGNRTLREHAFVDVRWMLPTSVKFVDSYANNQGGGNQNRGKLEGLDANTQQVGWINHYVRAGQVQGPFYIILDNSSSRAFETHSWLWFSTADQAFRRNGNYVSSGLRAGGAPLSWSAEFATAASASGLPGGAR